MRKITLGLLSVSMICLLSGCGGNIKRAKELSNQTLDIMNELASAVESIKDKSSLDAAKTKIDGLLNKLEPVMKELKTIKGTKAQKKEIDDEFMPKMKTAQARFQSAVQKAIRAYPAAQGVIRNMGQRMISISQK